MARQPFLDIRSLTKYYGEGEARTCVLDSIDFSLDAGEFCVVLGPSGSGKSTFLNLIGGLETANEGSIMVDGQDICTMRRKDLGAYRRKKLGFVFQFYNLVADLTLQENIESCAVLSDNPLPLDGLLKELGLYEHRNAFPRQVSGGQQQRCAIGRALSKKPSLLLCDEPTGALDSKTAGEVINLIEHVNQRYGCTTVVVTHNEALTRKATRVIKILDGKIVECRTRHVETDASFAEQTQGSDSLDVDPDTSFATTAADSAAARVSPDAGNSVLSAASPDTEKETARVPRT